MTLDNNWFQFDLCALYTLRKKEQRGPSAQRYAGILKNSKYRNPSINTINAFYKSAVLRKFRVKRVQKSMAIKIMRENSNNIS